MKILDNIEFDESKNLSKQSKEFQQWYNEKVNPLITDKLIPDRLDIYKRPLTYTVIVDSLTIVIYPQYIYKESSNWACSDFLIKININ